MTTGPEATPPGESSADPQPWTDRFVQLLEAQPTPERPGNVIGVRGVTSLAPLQDLASSWRRRQVYRSARYRLTGPSLGSLLVAFVSDLDTIALDQADPKGGASEPADPLVGDLRDGRGPDWTPLDAGPALANLSSQMRWRTAGRLSPDWQRVFFELMTDALGPNERLLLFAELDGRPADHWTDLDAVAGQSEKIKIVVTWPWRDAMPTWMSPLELPLGPEPRIVADYADAPLAGDELADLDTLDRQWYAAALAKLVMLPGTGPMTIGIHGRWGTGKSSFMRFIRNELVRAALPRSAALEALAEADSGVIAAMRQESQHLEGQYDQDAAARRRQRLAEAIAARWQLLDRLERAVSTEVLCVRFNAWLYEGSTQIWAGLTHDITSAMERSMSWRRRMRVRVGYALRVNGPAFWIGAAAAVVLAMLLASLALLLGAADNARTSNLPPGLDVVAGLLPAGSVVAIGLLLAWRLSKGFVPVSSRIAGYLRQPDYREEMGYQHQVRRDIEFLKARLGGQPRVVVFVDDLDRCSDERVLETLQAINLLLNESGFYVFLGIDTEMIINAIERWYRTDSADTGAGEGADDTAERARSYLDKILQLNVPLRELGSAQAFEYLSDFFSREAVRDYRSRQPVEPPDDLFEPIDRGELRWEREMARRPPVYDFQVRLVEDTADELGAFDALRDHLMPNPRELKRLLNVHRLVRLLARQGGWRPGPAERRLIVGWLLYCFARPDAAAGLVAAARKNPDGTVHDQALAPFITDTDDAEAAVLTNAMLQPGMPLGETWEIAALFRRHTATRRAAIGPS